jgi:hypothetical protein
VRVRHLRASGQPRSAFADFELEPVSLDMPVDEELDVSVLLLVLGAEYVLLVLPVLPVPLAPMLDVPLLSELLDVLGEALAEPLSEPLLVPDAPIVLELFLLASVLLLVLDALVPPVPDVPELPPVCAMAMPPTARAAAVARVVSVFLVVVMSCSLNGQTPKGIG